MKPSLALLLALGMVSARAADIERQSVTLDFGDFQSKGEWTYPKGVKGPLPAVILIHGSAAADMDYTKLDRQGQLKSSVFADLAQALSQRGIAVLRYNKHYVSGPGQVDYDRYVKADLNTFLKDAGTALAAAGKNPRVNPKNIFLYGWSEGSVVASALATQHPELRGLILQGPVVLPFRQASQAQFSDVQLPYLRQLAPQGLNETNLEAAYNGPGGSVARGVFQYLVDWQAVAGVPPRYRVSPDFDTNGDGTLDLDREVVPGMVRALDAAYTPQGVYRIYAPGRALPIVTQQVPKLKLPVLVLQGENDANTPAKYLSALQDAFKTAGTDATVKRYPGLGHSLGPAKSLIDDDFRPIAAQPMQDAADWVLAHSR